MEGFKIVPPELRGRKPGPPHVIITNDGDFYFNKNSVVLFRRFKLLHFLLMWDKKEKVIGFKPLHGENDPRTYKMCFPAKGNFCLLKSKAFTDYIGYKEKRSKHISIEWDEREQMFLAKIPEECFKNE